MKHRIAAGLLTVCLLAPTIPGAQAASFRDVPEAHWSYNFVEKAAANSLVSGMGDGTFGLTTTVTNAQWGAMVANLFYTREVDAYTSMNSSSPHWWTPYMVVTAQSGVFAGTEVVAGMNGMNWDVEKVGGAISRYDMAQVIYNIAVKNGWPQPGGGTAPAKIFDWAGIPGNYRAAVDYCFTQGFVTGVDDKGTFDGSALMTRGAAAVVLCRMLDAKNGTHGFDGTGESIGGVAPTVTDVQNMIAISTGGGNYKYQITVSNSLIPGKLSNSKDITESNILAMLKELETMFPGGTSWGDGANGDHYRYSQSAFVPTGGGCNAWAGMVADTLYGLGIKPISTHSNLANVKVGDVVQLYNASTKAEHWLVVMGIGTDVAGYTVFYTCDGNNNGKVVWNLPRTTVAMTRDYPDSTVFSFY